MLKHNDILENMSAKQKISLISDISRLADSEYNELGIPYVEISTVDELFEADGEGLSPTLLARTWDTNLVSLITQQVIAHREKCANVILVPSPKIDFNGANKNSLSEDPLLACRMSTAFLEAINKSEITGVIPDFYINENEVNNLDKSPNKSVLNEFFINPFSTAASNGEAKAVIGSISKNVGEYESFNKNILREQNKYFSSETDMLCMCKTYDETLYALEENCIIFRGVEAAIQNAYERYLSLKDSIEKGRASMLNLEEAFEARSAISNEMLDAAADKVIDFAFRYGKPTAKTYFEPAEDENAVDYTVSKPENNDSDKKAIEPYDLEEYQRLKVFAIEKSTVMLKNENKALPAKRNLKYAIIGDAAFVKNPKTDTMFADYFMEESNGNCIGSERGYNLTEDRSDSLIAPAVELAKKAATVFVFLKPHAQKPYANATLPANQIALLSALSKCKCKIVAIVDTKSSIDISFEKYTDSLLLAPISAKCSATAISQIVFGNASAGGNLTTTFYISPDAFHKKIRFYKENGRNKIGPFMGYRFYDTQDIEAKYPFGFGLKYSPVEYSNIRVSGNKVSFTATNNGSIPVDENAQIYVGMAKSKLVRPNKELKAFVSFHLNPCESKTVTISNINYSAYNEATDSYISETGNYTLYLASSISSTALSVKLSINGRSLFTKPPKLSDYLQSQSNIISNEFTLEAKHSTMTNHTNLRNSGFFCLFAALIVGLMATSTSAPIIPIVIAAALLIGAAILFVIAKQTKAKNEEAAEEIANKNKELFKDADTVSESNLEDLFVTEFDDQIPEVFPTVEDNDEEYVDMSATQINDSISFETAAADLRKYASESGVGLSADSASSVIAAFASSKIIFTKSLESEKAQNFVTCIANYFGANLFVEAVTDAHRSQDRLLRTMSEDGISSPTAILAALISAVDRPDTMHVIHVKGIRSNRMSEYLTPYIKYFSNPASNAKISAKGSDDAYTIPSNVWFVFDIERSDLVENIPAYILEHAVVLPVKYSDSDVISYKTPFTPIAQKDFEYLSEKTRAKHLLHEDIWKKIDTVEAFATKHSSYTIGNKFWLQIETYISILLSVNTELAVAVDSTLASVILPALAASLVGKTSNSEKNIIDEAERVFGEDNIPLCHSMLVSESDM